MKARQNPGEGLENLDDKQDENNRPQIEEGLSVEDMRMLLNTKLAEFDKAEIGNEDV